jgi:hypothetical protein
MWFDSKDIIHHNVIELDDLHGYVLPHAGTEFTGRIISHTLRFRPTKLFTKILILYYPASTTFDVEGKYFHEYYVPWKSLETIFGKNIIYEGFNVSNSTKKLPLISDDTLVIVSADFSHFLPLNEAIELENNAAHSLMFKHIDKDLEAVDDMKTFKLLYDIIPNEWLLQWIGRTRSNGIKGVGYLSFLLREIPQQVDALNSNGMFVTAFSEKMTARECLGEWFNGRNKWTIDIEKKLIEKVLHLGRTTSRLTGGTELEIPLTNYTVTYLYKTKSSKFIRGWHGILHHAFFLPEVFLENTYENGVWIKPNDKEWPSINNFEFNLQETLRKLNIKADMLGGTKKTKKSIHKKNKTLRKNKGGINYTLFNSKVAHYLI